MRSSRTGDLQEGGEGGEAGGWAGMVAAVALDLVAPLSGLATRAWRSVQGAATPGARLPNQDLAKKIRNPDLDPWTLRRRTALYESRQSAVDEPVAPPALSSPPCPKGAGGQPNGNPADADAGPLAAIPAPLAGAPAQPAPPSEAERRTSPTAGPLSALPPSAAGCQRKAERPWPRAGAVCGAEHGRRERPRHRRSLRAAEQRRSPFGRASGLDQNRRTSPSAGISDSMSRLSG
jgi:hypothetical protein